LGALGQAVHEAVLKKRPKPPMLDIPFRYEIILLVDSMEVVGGSAGGKKSRKNITPEELQSLGVVYEMRKLSIGDFVWIARSLQPGSDKRKELVLPYIIERKRMDDLRSSIMDGRYKEQKQRIQQCGLTNKV
jgi:crossover junction endonuclease MUS81